MSLLTIVLLDNNIAKQFFTDTIKRTKKTYGRMN